MQKRIPFLHKFSPGGSTKGPKDKMAKKSSPAPSELQRHFLCFESGQLEAGPSRVGPHFILRWRFENGGVFSSPFEAF